MSATGPELPPHLLAKRKRQQEEEQKDQAAKASGANTESSEISDKRQRTTGLESPPITEVPSVSTLSTLSTLSGPSISPSLSPPPRRVVGPAPPPAPLDERPSEPANPQPSDSESESDSDDDFGPTLPSAADAQRSLDEANRPVYQQDTAPVKAQRDEWMTLPPEQDDLAARMDPSKLRSRGFNTSKSARGGAVPKGISSAWTETPEEKLKRLQDEAMGVNPTTVPGPEARDKAKSKEREEQARRIREHTDKTRGPSLMERHQETNPQEKEDDPSKRAFDREKDMGVAGRLGQGQKKEMLNKTSLSFSEKFSGGGYL